MERVNVLIIGGGVVGCAIACEVSTRTSDVFLVEQQPKLGMGASTRNSGVIHSGIYYAADSLKARHCLAGNRLTYEFCAAHEVPHRRTGKLLVATNSHEVKELEALVERGRANGVEGLRIIGREEIHQKEPHVAGEAAIEVPSTGIVSSEELVKTYARVAVERGASVVTHSRVEAIEAQGEAVRVRLRTGENTDTVETRCLVNAAGLFADEVAALASNNSWRIYPVRGEYCEAVRAKASLINGLVYPLPHPEGLSLGVHLTKTLWGTLLVGPTARYIEDKNDYEKDREPVEHFARGAKLLLPEIEAADLVQAYSGIRAKLVPPGEKGPADFVITRDAHHPRIIHLVGIESPGLTSAPSIATQVDGMIRETLG